MGNNPSHRLWSKRSNPVFEVVKNPATTARWEQTLEEIAAGKADLEEFLYDQKDVLAAMLDQLTGKQS